tara:strand:- start:466 stop:708 length:243 start_codon:yes stop_codon:yes gene_type:complete
MTSSTIRNTNNITDYNNLRNALIILAGYNYQQLFGLKMYELEDLFYYNEPTVRYKVTGRKRDWVLLQWARFVDFFDLYEG